MKDTQWFCPHCDAENIDDPTETAMPMCGDCLESFHWDEIEDREFIDELDA